MTIQKSINYNLYNLNGQKLNLLKKLNLKIVSLSGNYLIHKNIINQQTLKRNFTVSTKTRSEVQGGGKKPWRQKGTGKARVGSTRSPLWKGGGVIFGPKPKNISLKLNKKEKRLAIQTLLYNKKESTLILEDLENKFEKPETKYFLEVCRNCKIDINQKLLIIVSKKTKKLRLALQNLKNVELISASNLNLLSLIKANQIILTPFAIDNIKEIFCD